MNELIESGNFLGPPGLQLNDNDYVVTTSLSCSPTIQVDIGEGMKVVFCEEIANKNAELAEIDAGHIVPCQQIEWNDSLWNVYRMSSKYTPRHKNETQFLWAVHFGPRKEWSRKRLSFWLVPDNFFEGDIYYADGSSEKRSKLGTCFRPTKLKDGNIFAEI